MMRDRLQSRSASRRQAPGGRAREIDLPIPLRGLYVRADTAKVSNMFAAELNNWRSTGTSMRLRPGASWEGRYATDTLQRIPFEFAGTARYIEVSATGLAAGSATMSRTMSTPAAASEISSQVIIADGNGQPVRYDGSAFQNAGFTSAATLQPETCDGIIAHHDHVLMWPTNGQLGFLYAPVGAVTGPMSYFPLDRLGNITGSIYTMRSLTIDAGHGMNDVLAIFTTTGQMILYEGSDPSDPNDWRLLARIQSGVPIGQRAFTQVGSDVWVLTPQGVVSIAQSARQSVLALSSELSAPISDEISRLVDAGGGEWQLFTANDGSFVVINRVENDEAQQFFYYIESKSWAHGDLRARDWHNLAGRPEITGMDGRRGMLSHSGSNETITARWVSSWFTTRSGTELTYLLPTIIATGPLTVRVVVLTDHNDTPADIAEAEQTITIEPEEDGAARVALRDIIPTDATGDEFQITLEVTAKWAEMTGIKAATA